MEPIDNLVAIVKAYGMLNDANVSSAAKHVMEAVLEVRKEMREK